MINKTYLLLGSNIGNGGLHLQKAKRLIEETIGVIQKKSSLYITAAWGNTNQNDFINQIIIVHTKFSAADLLIKIHAIEKKMGRVRTTKNAAREIDIDILFYNNEIIYTKDLIIPHKEISNRKFVLVPMAEIAPTLLHPLLKKQIKTLLKNCTDTLNVQKI